MTSAIVLAAGGSSRLGRPKQLVRVDGAPLVRRAARAAIDGGCAPVLVVVGAEADRVRSALAGLPVEIVDNRSWREGIGSSIRVGVARLLEREADGALLLVCDQLRLDAGIVRRVLATVAAHPGVPVACRYAGVAGVPAYVPGPELSSLAGLTGDRGAGGFLRRRPDLVTVDWAEGELDLDRPDDAGSATSGRPI